MNAIAAAARQSAVEVKKHSLRQSRDGLIVSFVCHPNDIPDSLLTSPIGQRYVLALVAVDDDEQPMISPTPAKQSDKSEVAKAAYNAKSEGEQAVVRAALLARDPRFQGYALASNETDAADYIRRRCAIESRREIATHPAALDWFLILETEFRQFAGLEAAP